MTEERFIYQEMQEDTCLEASQPSFPFGHKNTKRFYVKRGATALCAENLNCRNVGRLKEKRANENIVRFREAAWSRSRSVRSAIYTLHALQWAQCAVCTTVIHAMLGLALLELPSNSIPRSVLNRNAMIVATFFVI